MSSIFTQAINSRPRFISRFSANKHSRSGDITENVQNYFTAKWPWTSEAEKERYRLKDLEGWGLSIIGDTDLTRAEIFTLWMTWLFLWDDRVERMSSADERAALTRLIGIFSEASVLENITVLESMALDLRERLISVGDEAFRNLGKKLMEDTFHSPGVRCSKQDRAQAMSGGYEIFIEYRVQDAASWLAFGFLCWARGVFLPADLESSGLIPLVKAALLHATLINDFYSYEKEAKVLQDAKLLIDGKHEFMIFNTVAFIMAEKKVSLADAYAKVKEKIHGVEDEYQRILAELRVQFAADGRDPNLLEAASALCVDLMGGNAAWSETCGRYNLA